MRPIAKPPDTVPGGRIAAVGSHEELLANNELYREIWHSQNRGSGKSEEGGDGDANA